MEAVQLQLYTRTINAELYQADKAPAPGIVFLHDLTGIQEANRQAARLLAEGGFHVLLPDLYTGMGRNKYCVRFLFEEALRNNEADGNEPLNEILEILDHFKTFPGVDAQQMGMIGQCLTGGFVLHAAIRPEMKAPVVFHHSLGVRGSGVPASCSSLIKNKVQGHFVYLDAFCPPKRIRQLERELEGKLEKHLYALPHGIPHLFFRTRQGRKAFDRMMRFFQDQFQDKV